METLKQRLEEQQGRHQGGSKWIGTGGTSPFGHGGYNPEGVRIGGDGQARPRDQGLGPARVPQPRRRPANSAPATSRSRCAACAASPAKARPTSSTSTATIDGTARQGWLDVHMRPERHNAVKLLLFLDVGGSMDGHVKLCEELFSAARTEFKHLEHFYFHNCIYEGVWKDNRRRFAERTPTFDVMHKFGHDHKLVFVGDAAMSPYEITHAGGSIEHMNEEAGAVWLQRLTDHLSRRGLAQPDARAYWGHSAFDRDPQAADARPHVPADAGRPRRCDAGA